MAAAVARLPHAVARAPFEDARRAIAGGWDVEACLVEDGLTVVDRIQQAAANHAEADVLPFAGPRATRNPLTRR